MSKWFSTSIFWVLTSVCFGTQFLAEDTIHFIGGVGTKAGHASSAGGCTKAAWDANPDINNFVATDGIYIAADAVGGTITNNGTGSVRLTGAIVWTSGWSSIVVGTLIRVDFAATYTDGVYEITAYTDAGTDTIDIDLTYSADTTYATFYIGGAFTTLATALADDSTICSVVGSATLGYSRFIYTNKDETELAKDGVNAWAINVATGGMQNINSATLSFRSIIGFATQPGDLDFGSAGYKTKPERMIAYGDNTHATPDTALYPNLTTQTNIEDCFTLNIADAADYTVIRNLYIGNEENTTSNVCINIAAAATGCTVSNCLTYYGYRGIEIGASTAQTYVFDSCAVKGGELGFKTASTSFVNDCYFVNNVTYGTSSAGICIITNCLYIGGGTGAFGSAGIILSNCVFYNQTTQCIWDYTGASQTMGVIVFACILSPATTTTTCISTPDGTTDRRTNPVSRCLFYCIAQSAVMASAAYEDNGFAQYALRVNPHFRNIAAYDFEIRNRSVRAAGFGFNISERIERYRSRYQ